MTLWKWPSRPKYSEWPAPVGDRDLRSLTGPKAVRRTHKFSSPKQSFKMLGKAASSGVTAEDGRTGRAWDHVGSRAGLRLCWTHLHPTAQLDARKARSILETLSSAIKASPTVQESAFAANRRRRAVALFDGRCMRDPCSYESVSWCGRPGGQLRRPMPHCPAHTRRQS